MKTTHGKIPRRTRDLNLLGGAVWILPGVAKILATLLSTGAFATDERGMARVLMHPPARALETSSHELYLVHRWLIRLQRIYNFLLLHAIIYSILDV